MINSGGTWIDPGDVGIIGGPDVVTEWDTNPLSMTFYLEAATVGGSFVPFFSLFDNNNCGQACEGFAVSEFYTKYFYTMPLENPSEVPLPAALPLLLSALGFFGFFGWRKKQAAGTS